MMKRLIVLCFCFALLSGQSYAQEPFNIAVRPEKLATMLTQLYGPEGLIVDSLAVLESGDTHSAHFNSAFQTEFTQFSTALTSRLAAAPLPSPASGFTYEFDPSLGVFNRTTQSFGPILAERAETIGGGRFSFGFTFQHFNFDTLEGQDLRSIPAVFTHDHAERRGGREDVVTTMNSITARINQFTVFLSYGLTDRFDVSVAIPLVSNDLQIVSDARIQRIGTASDEIHFFREADDNIGEQRIFTAFGSASGLGDLTIRLKGNFWRAGGLSLGTDLRVPTGDEQDLLGVGAAGFKPFLIWSSTFGAISPHVNAGYQWNGSSVLAGDPTTGESKDLPDQGFLTVGADFGVGSRFTLAVDVLGQYFVDSPRMIRENFRALDGISVFPTVRFEEDSFLVLNGAVGFKLNVFQQLLVDFNLLFNLNDNGLQDKVTPLVGIEYAF
jgi:hypothetical protein